MGKKDKTRFEMALDKLMIKIFIIMQSHLPSGGFVANMPVFLCAYK
jgi:hypothetical protein